MPLMTSVSAANRPTSDGFISTFLPTPDFRTRARPLPPLLTDRLPVLGKMVGRAPRERLESQRRIAGAARPHHRSTEYAQVRRLVRETPSVDHVGFRIIPHARAAVGMRGWSHRANRVPNCRDSASPLVPLLHLVLDKSGTFALVLLVVGGDPADRKAQRIFHHRIEVEIVAFVWQSRLLAVRGVRAVSVFFDECFPCSTPRRRSAERGHARSRNRPPVGIDPEIAPTHEIEPRVVEVVIRPVVDRDALSWQAIPVVQVPREKRSHARGLVVAEVVLPHLAMVI